ncbi:MAG: Type I restriction enzyme EcoKI M protein [Syntrophorhabdus sp. PtaU1.Bin002]|nr:MAG: Type I restriction enzyme EcoKI M protein [Syntrophorhabdus sp. PtaB.Bin006]OPY71944.1 MAG: Type I restriction enzyme EcoKI M protein [Syntrophorhabdus sp. PtaU1.Bin002]
MKQVDHNGGGDNIRLGDSFIDDQFHEDKFDYFLTNPPFGVDWKKQQKEIVREHEKMGFGGRFGAGFPRVNDGSLLFLQHMIDKFEPVLPDQLKHGSRLAIVFSGSPLFSGGAGSGESNIRKWIIENDWLEAIIALPEQMFYKPASAPISGSSPTVRRGIARAGYRYLMPGISICLCGKVLVINGA